MDLKSIITGTSILATGSTFLYLFHNYIDGRDNATELAIGLPVAIVTALGTGVLLRKGIYHTEENQMDLNNQTNSREKFKLREGIDRRGNKYKRIDRKRY